MPKVHLQRRMRHAPKDMLALVSNVEAYPDFIDLISAVRILSRKQTSDTREEFIADVGIQYKFVSETFRSQVIVDHALRTLSIARSGHGGAVRVLENDWKFIELKDGSTLVDFKLNVRLKAMPLEFLIKQKIDKATRHIMNAFEVQAAKIFTEIGDKEYDYKSESQS